MKTRIFSFRLDEKKVEALDAIARRLGCTRNDLVDQLIGLAANRAPGPGWTCRTVRLVGTTVETSGILEAQGDAGYSTEMVLPDEAWSYLEQSR